MVPAPRRRMGPKVLKNQWWEMVDGMTETAQDLSNGGNTVGRDYVHSEWYIRIYA